MRVSLPATIPPSRPLIFAATLGLMVATNLGGCGDRSSGVEREAGRPILIWHPDEQASPAIERLRDWFQGGDGTLYLADSRGGTVHIRRPGGGEWSQLGRRGEGPGEFLAITGIVSARNGDLWVLDSRKRSLTRFNNDGTEVQVVPWTGAPDLMPRQPVMSAGGTLVGIGFERTSRTGSRRLLVRAAPPEWNVRTQALPEVSQELFEIRGTNGNLAVVAEVPLSPTALWALADASSAWVATSREYRISLVTAAGDTTLVVTRTVPALAVTDSLRRRLLVETLGEEYLVHPDVDPERIPRDLPPITRLVSTSDSGLVVERHQADGIGASWDRFSRDGRFIGTWRTEVRFSERYRVLERDGLLMGVVEDADGLPSIVGIPLGASSP